MKEFIRVWDEGCGLDWDDAMGELLSVSPWMCGISASVQKERRRWERHSTNISFCWVELRVDRNDVGTEGEKVVGDVLSFTVIDSCRRCTERQQLIWGGGKQGDPWGDYPSNYSVVELVGVCGWRGGVY